MRPAADRRRPDRRVPRCRRLADVREPAADRPIDLRRTRPAAASATARSRRSKACSNWSPGGCRCCWKSRSTATSGAGSRHFAAALAGYRRRVRRHELRSAPAAPAEDQPARRSGAGWWSATAGRLLSAGWRLAGRSPFPRAWNARHSTSPGSLASANAGRSTAGRSAAAAAADASAGSCGRAYLGSRWPTVKPSSSRKLASGRRGLDCRGLGPPGRRRPVRRATPSCRALEDPDSVGARDRLDARADPGRGRSCASGRRRARLSEEPQPGRICLRPRLGRRIQRAGGAYYPKLQIAVPFTPVPGRRLLGDRPQQLLAAAEAVTCRTDVLGAHHIHRRSRGGRVPSDAAG